MDKISSSNPTTREDIPYLRTAHYIISGPAFTNVPKLSLTMPQTLQLVSLNHGAGTHAPTQHEYTSMRVIGLLFHSCHLLFVEHVDTPGQYVPFNCVWHKGDPDFPDPKQTTGKLASGLINHATGIKKGIRPLGSCVLQYSVLVGGDEVGGESEQGVWTWVLQQSWVVDGEETPPVALNTEYYKSVKWLLYSDILEDLDTMLPKWMHFGVVQAFDRYSEYVTRSGEVTLNEEEKKEAKDPEETETETESESEEVDDTGEVKQKKKKKYRKQRKQKKQKQNKKKRH